jgi:hypothetical protein
VQKNIIIVFAVGLVLGVTGAGVCAHIRELGQIKRFDRERTELEREYDKRQRELEIRLEHALGTVAGAREITERAGEKLTQSAGNLREAGRIIGEIYQQIRELDDWFNSRGSGSSGGGNSGGDVN